MDNYIPLLLFVTTANVISAKSILGNYYWREYTGVTPGDALLGGHDANGYLIYMGQVLHSNKLIPGKLYANDKVIYYELEEQAWSTVSNIKILCTDHSESFEWVPTTVHDVHKLGEETTLIKGGYQPNFLTYIGRVHLDGRTEVGKIICRQTSCLGLYTNENGRSKAYHKFEILTYNPDNENALARNISNR